MVTTEEGIPVGLCQCGCGTAAPLDRRGKPQRFVRGHQTRGRTWDLQGRQRADLVSIGKAQNYLAAIAPNHPRANRAGRVREHVLVAERALGKVLPAGAVVHHVNGITTDNRPENLVVCQDHMYHSLLHRRQRAYDACGNASARICVFCHTYDRQGAIVVRRRKDGGEQTYHKDCKARVVREAHRRKRSAHPPESPS